MHTTTRYTQTSLLNRFVFSLLLTATMAICGMGMAMAQDTKSMTPGTPDMKSSSGLTTLITATPEEGFALAVKLSQKGVATTQPDAELRKALRPAYAHDPNSLIAISHVIATHFQTIAAANDYWQD